MPHDYVNRILRSSGISGGLPADAQARLDRLEAQVQRLGKGVAAPITAGLQVATAILVDGAVTAVKIASGALTSHGDVTATATASKIPIADGSAKLDTWVSYAPGGTDVAVADGGTGSSTASGARTNLGVAYGTSAGTVAEGNDSRIVSNAVASTSSGKKVIGGSTSGTTDADGDLTIATGLTTVEGIVVFCANATDAFAKFISSSGGNVDVEIMAHTGSTLNSSAVTVYWIAFGT